MDFTSSVFVVSNYLSTNSTNEKVLLEYGWACYPWYVNHGDFCAVFEKAESVERECGSDSFKVVTKS